MRVGVGSGLEEVVEGGGQVTISVRAAVEIESETEAEG